MGGDGLRLIQTIKRVDFQTAAALVETIVGKVDAPESRAKLGGGKSDKPSDPMKPWREAGPFLADSPVDRYFRARALIITESEARSLRYAEEPVSLAIENELAVRNRPDHARRPARLSAAIRPSSSTTGQGKAPIERPRLFAAGGKTIGGGVWFGKADAHSEFVVAEGVESTLSAACACLTSRRASRP